MTDLAPFRERPKFRLCPRCGEILEPAFEGVLACLRCEGMWITPGTLMGAFGDPRWPPDAHGMWWRNELECPECAAEGTATIMSALIASGTQIDRCPAHGLWLDRGELGRLMGTATDELDALRARLTGVEPAENLAKRRAAWRFEASSRRKAAEEYRKWLETEHRRRVEAEAKVEAEPRAAPRDPADDDRTRSEREHMARVRDQQARERAEVERERAELERARLDFERESAEREQTRLDQRLGEARAAAEIEVSRHEAHLIALREELRRTEAELDGARTRLRAIDDQRTSLGR